MPLGYSSGMPWLILFIWVICLQSGLMWDIYFSKNKQIVNSCLLDTAWGYPG